MKENPDKGRKGSVSAAVTDGRRIDFLGYCFTHGNVRLRKSIERKRKSERQNAAWRHGLHIGAGANGATAVIYGKL